MPSESATEIVHPTSMATISVTTRRFRGVPMRTPATTTIQPRMTTGAAHPLMPLALVGGPARPTLMKMAYASPRYFLLKSDGSFRGYKSIPKAGDAPINYFDIMNSTLSLDDKSVKSGKYGFVVR